MKKIVISLLVSTFLYAQPPWYQHSNEAQMPNHYIGFGEGASEAEAKQNALNDIALQISVKIENELVQNKTNSNEGFEKKIQMKSVQKTSASLSDYKVIKFEQQNDRFYFKIGYENISNIDKLIEKLSKLQSTNQVLADAKTHKLFQSSSIAKTINERFGCEIELQIERRSGNWFLKSNQISQVLNQDEFVKFLIPVANSALRINTTKKDNVLFDGDEFYYKIESIEDGYASIVSVYEDGTVCTLLKNQQIKKDDQNILPDSKSDSVPVAGLLTPNAETFEIVFVILSQNKLNFDTFADSLVDTTDQDKYKNFGEFAKFLDDKLFSSIKVITKSR